MTTTDPSPASMGGPLSEAERLAEIRRSLKMAKMASANAPGTFWHTFTENAEFLLELVGVLEGQLATAREALAENVAEYDREIASLTPPTTMSREDEEFRDLARAEAAEARRCLDLFDRALGLDGGGPDGTA